MKIIHQTTDFVLDVENEFGVTREQSGKVFTIGHAGSHNKYVMCRENFLLLAEHIGFIVAQDAAMLAATAAAEESEARA